MIPNFHRVESLAADGRLYFTIAFLAAVVAVVAVAWLMERKR